MPEAEVAAVVACVAAIISAYHDGNTLVSRIKERREERRRALAEGPTEALEDSLTLGPLIVQGEYDNNYRRFGERYAQGDQIAREQLKDIIINLQSALLINLRLLWQNDDAEPDFAALQTASDNSRIDAVVALCQLYQRLASAAPLQAGPNMNTMPSTAVSKRVVQQWSVFPALPERKPSHASTVSSNTNISDGYSSIAPSDSVSRRSSVEPQSPLTRERRSSSIGSTSSRKPFSLRSIRNPRPQAPSGNLVFRNEQFPITPVCESAEADWTAMYGRTGFDGPTSMPFHTQPHLEYLPQEPALSGMPFSPDEIYSPWNQPDLNREMAMAIPSPLRIPSKPSERDGLQRNPSPARWPDPLFQSSNSDTATDLSSARHIHPSSSTVSRHPSSNSTSTSGSNSNSTPSSTSNPNPIPVPIPVVPMALYLPSEENNFAGFCKGAWKLQLGLKKAFSAEIRPEGMYSNVPFWRCSKCYYEGPMMTISSSGSSGSRSTRKTKTFDTRVRVHPPTGIRYRWAFLAKSHVSTRRFLAMKTSSDKDGSAGTFGCIFCCAERRTAAPIFGNLASFMEHLLQHRSMSSVEALLERTRCIVGRVAGNDEDFDVNLPPVG
ncbi:hypothetical protein VTN00DRAFT_2986 [Thermoascus crustaceus]|uniref:uncharacterized protein n=1 Tax=Thermoascus crustaceus TaxID=5088 RepID=UPI0037433F9A